MLANQYSVPGLGCFSWYTVTDIIIKVISNIDFNLLQSQNGFELSQDLKPPNELVTTDSISNVQFIDSPAPSVSFMGNYFKKASLAIITFCSSLKRDKTSEVKLLILPSEGGLYVFVSQSLCTASFKFQAYIRNCKTGELFPITKDPDLTVDPLCIGQQHKFETHIPISFRNTLETSINIGNSIN